MSRVRRTGFFLAGLVLVAGVPLSARERPAERSTSVVARTARPLQEPTPAAIRRLESWQGFPCFMGPGGAVAPSGGTRRLSTLVPAVAAAGSAPRPHGSAPARAGAAWPARFAGSDLDTLRVAFLRVDFRTDRGGDTTSTPDGKFDLRRDATAVVDPPPHDRAYFESHGEALARYFRAQSDGHLEIESTVFPTEADSAFHLGDTMDYGPWSVVADNVDVAEEAERLIRDALEQARLSGQVDFTAFDAFIVVHAGADFQTDVNGDSPRDIPTFVLEFGEPVVIDGKTITRVMVLPETVSQDGLSGALNGALAHEFGHILGLPDLYNARTGVPSVGYWSIMDSGHNIPAILVDTDGSEVEVFGALPSSYDAWCRLQLFVPDDAPGGGFLGPRVLVVDDSLHRSLGSVLTDHEMILCAIHDTEYYLVENRATDLDGNGFPIIRADAVTGVILGPEADSTLADSRGGLEHDALLPSGGLLVWHVDDRVLFGDLSDPFGINTNIRRRGVKVIEADGIEDQGRRNFGTEFDPFYRAHNGTFGPYTVPRTHSNDGQFSRITIETTSDPGVAMDVTVRRPTGVPGWPIGLSDELTVTRTTQLDVSGDGRPEMLFTVGRDIIAVEGRGGLPYPTPDEPGTAIPWVRYSSSLDPRLAAGALRIGAGEGRATPVVAALATGNDRILAWDASANLLPQDAARAMINASTPPSLSRTDPLSAGPGLAYGDFAGRAHLAGPTGPGLVSLGRVADTEAALAGGEPDAAVGNVISGFLSSESGGIEVAWITESGRVHLATTIGATPGGGPDGTTLLRTLGSTIDPVGTGRNLSILAANFRGPGRAAYDLAAVDRSGRATLLDLQCEAVPGWPVDLPAPLVGHAAAGDMDGDGGAELVLADTLGNIVVLNADGTNALHYPVNLGSRPTSGAMLAWLDEEPGAEILVATEDGGLHALNRLGKEVTGFPIALGGGQPAGPILADLNGDGRLDIAGGSANHLLVATGIDVALPDSLIAWAGEENGAGRNAVLDRRAARVGGANPAAGRTGELVCFPNPARGERMNIRLFLEAGQEARADVFDILGRPVAVDLKPEGAGLEANIPWALGDVAPGVYLVRVSVSGDGAPETRVRTVSVLK